MVALNKLVRLSLDHSVIVIIFSSLFFGLGIYSIQKLKMDAIPDITNTQVQIVTSSPSLSAMEMEQFITYPIERALGGVPHIAEMRSISRYGISLVTLVFEEDVSIWKARQMVSERMVEIQKTIPPHYGIPEMAPLTTALGEVVQFTLKSNQHNPRELTSTIEWYISPLLKTIPGIVDVNLFGGQIRQFQILLDRNKMAGLGVSNQEVMDAVRSNNLSSGGGYIESRKEHYIIGLPSLVLNTDDLKSIALGRDRNGAPVFLRMIAEIKEGFELRKGAATENGKSEVVGGIALMLTGENSLVVSNAVEEKLREIQTSLPEGMKIELFYNRSEMVTGAIRTILFNLGEGAFLVVVILFLMMGSVRSGLIISIIIPMCMLTAIIIMVMREAPANLMSMGAIDFGLLVDGAVIVVENASRRLSGARNQLGRILTPEERKEIIYSATTEVRKATIYGEIIIGIVYIPILAMSGTEGLLFRPMALTVLFALSGAFLFTLTLVPCLVFHFLKEPKNWENSEEAETKVFRKIKIGYHFLLTKAFRHKRGVFVSGIFFFLVSIALFPFLGREFIPVLDEGATLLEITRLPSTSLQESISSGMRMERSLLNKKFPEINSIVSKTGSPNLALEPMGIEKTDVFIQLKPRSEWNRSKDELLDSISREMESNFPEVAFGISQPIEMRSNEMIAGIRSDIGVKIFGKDLDQLKSLAEKSVSLLKEIDGVRDIRIEQLGGISYIKLIPNREKMAQYNIRSEDISQLAKMVASGLVVDQVLDGARKYNIVLKIQNPPNESIASWRNLLVSNSFGRFYPLGEVVDVIQEEGPAQIGHEWQERRVLLEFNVRGRDTISVLEESESVLKKEFSLPPGYRYEFDGTFKYYLSAMKSLYLIVPITLVLVFLILWFAVRSYLVSFLLFTNIAFALTGGILSLFLRGIPFSISAGVGFIALCGIAVLNSLVLVTFSLKREETGESPSEAIFHAAKDRLRPVIMTGLVAMLGFIPMAVATSPGSEVQRPLATVVIGGLITDTLLTLFVFPVMYAIFKKN